MPTLSARWLLPAFGVLFMGELAGAQDLGLNPTRPTIANAATVQNVGVLQSETGFDSYPQHVPGNTEIVSTSLSYTPLPRLRLDFNWASLEHQQEGTAVANGTGDVTLGGKVVLHKEDYHKPSPGIAIQYEAELPTASNQDLRSLGQQAILLVNHHYGKQGDLDVIVNGSVVQLNCNTVCSYGGQQAVALSYHLQKTTRLYAEAFAQNVPQSNSPPGTYVFGGFYHQFSEGFGIDGGVRFGVSNQAASIGTTVGVIFGRRLHGEGKPDGSVRQ